jgi:hypothetical protein
MSTEGQTTPQNNRTVAVNQNQDLEKTQNIKRGKQGLEVSAEPQAFQQENGRNLPTNNSQEIDRNGDGNAKNDQKKHNTDAVDLLNKKYSLGLDEVKGNNGTHKKGQQSFGFDSGITIGQRNTQDQSENFRPTRDGANAVELNFEDAKKNQNRNSNKKDQISQMLHQSHSEKHFFDENQNLAQSQEDMNLQNNIPICVREPPVIMPRQKIQNSAPTNQQKKIRNDLSVISSEMENSRGELRRNDSSQLNQNLKSNTNQDDRTVGSVREADFYF